MNQSENTYRGNQTISVTTKEANRCQGIRINLFDYRHLFNFWSPLTLYCCHYIIYMVAAPSSGGRPLLHQVRHGLFNGRLSLSLSPKVKGSATFSNPTPSLWLIIRMCFTKASSHHLSNLLPIYKVIYVYYINIDR